MTQSPVHRRYVFFVSGFDPKGASYYHGLYSSQAALQGAVTAVTYAVSGRSKRPNGNSRWTVDASSPAGTTHTTYEYARWDDIVRSRWPRNAFGVLAGSVRAYVSAIGSGRALLKVWRVAPKTLFSLAYPALFWLGVLLLAALAGWGVSTLAGAVIGLAAGIAVLAAALQWERRLHTSWLLRIYQFAADWAGHRIRKLPARLDGLAQDVHRQLQDPQIDEVLLVGFSVGSMLAISAAARIKQLASGTELQKLSVLTLGHCIPLLGLMPRARTFRAELAQVAARPTLVWADYSSPTDWGSFALVDPVTLCLGTKRGLQGPVLASPRFHTVFEPATYAQIRGDKRRMHLQYLMAGERPGNYDYFAFTAGPLRLADRLNPNPV
ncbi:MAG: hypothetical protein NVS3B2_08250 [Ramlibacter sp.]